MWENYRTNLNLSSLSYIKCILYFTVFYLQLFPYFTVFVPGRPRFIYNIRLSIYPSIDLSTCPFPFCFQLSFGGMPYSGKPVGGGRKNFKGCMESINYNGDNITDLARRKKLDTSSFVSVTFTISSHWHRCRRVQRASLGYTTPPTPPPSSPRRPSD